jgi:YHS domain-containing protein
MNGKKITLTAAALLVCMLLATLFVAGCKCCGKKAEKSASIGMEQTVCPISGKPINKEISTTYKGKTVYFCSPGCKTEFEKNPEKYASKLPQFQKARPGTSY